jgi:hypothetical protein
MARLVLVALVASSSALAAPPVAPSTFPPDNVALPRNARPVFFGFGTADAAFVRIDAEGETPLTFESRPSVFDDTAFTVDPGALEPGTELVIEPRCNCSPLGDWSVGNEVDDAPPVFEGEVTAQAQRQNLGTAQTPSDVFTIQIPSLADEGGPVLVRLVGDEIDEVQATPHFSGSTGVTALLSPGEARTTCVTVSAIDVAGNEASLPNEVCADFSGCSQAPASSAAVLAILTLLARRRRRT